MKLELKTTLEQSEARATARRTLCALAKARASARNSRERKHMTPERCKQIRKALGLSQKGLGRLIGMKGKSPERNIYDWENKPSANIPGPSANLLEYIAQGLPMTVQALKLPKHVLAGEDEESRPSLLMRLWRPRFIMSVADMKVIQWIDQPDDEDRDRVVGEAQEYIYSSCSVLSASAKE